MKTVAIIPAAGASRRIGDPVPKQFVEYNGKPMIVYALEVMQQSTAVDEIAVAVGRDWKDLMKEIADRFALSKVTSVVEGGKERQDTVYNAAASLDLASDDLCAVHDAARPLLPKAVLEAAVATAREKGNALVCIKARDTLLDIAGDSYTYPDRSSIYYVQTPQIFKHGDLMRAFELAKKEELTGTDESMLINRLGIHINLVEGSPRNFKITVREDQILFKQLLAADEQ